MGANEKPVELWSAMQAITRHFNAVDREVKRLLQAYERMDAALGERDRDIARLRRGNQELQGRVDDLTRELDHRTAGQLRRSPEVSSAENFRHIEIAAQFDSYVKQEVSALVQHLCEVTGPPPRRQHRIAELTARTVALVLREGIVEGATLIEELQCATTPPALETAERVCQIGDHINTLTEEFDNQPGWTFECSVGSPVDKATQRQWGGCDPQAPVAFVVLPGYRTDARVYRLQEVFTEM